jgi:hypothetical protein
MDGWMRTREGPFLFLLHGLFLLLPAGSPHRSGNRILPRLIAALCSLLCMHAGQCIVVLAFRPRGYCVFSLSLRQSQS